MPQPSTAQPFTFCDNIAALSEAVQALEHCRYIVFDCEGHNLGEEGGSLSVITLLGIPSASRNVAGERVYLIDAIALDDNELQPIYRILSGMQHVKIMFDGRLDCTCFYYTFGVTMRNVVDLQLAEINSRVGETESYRLKRLYSYIHPRTVCTSKSSLQHVQKLSPLGQCAEEQDFVIRKKTGV